MNLPCFYFYDLLYVLHHSTFALTSLNLCQRSNLQTCQLSQKQPFILSIAGFGKQVICKNNSLVSLYCDSLIQPHQSIVKTFSNELSGYFNLFNLIERIKCNKGAKSKCMSEFQIRHSLLLSLQQANLLIKCPTRPL